MYIYIHTYIYIHIYVSVSVNEIKKYYVKLHEIPHFFCLVLNVIHKTTKFFFFL